MVIEELPPVCAQRVREIIGRSASYSVEAASDIGALVAIIQAVRIANDDLLHDLQFRAQCWSTFKAAVVG